MYKLAFKFILAIVLFVGVGLSLDAPQASAQQCDWAPGSNWGVEKATDGGHGGAMGGLRVHTQMNNGAEVNVNFEVMTRFQKDNGQNAGNDAKIFNWPIGTGRTDHQRFNTGETLRDKQAGTSINCDGWTQLGPDTGGRMGNGHVIDCAKIIGDDYVPTSVWINDISNPPGKKGKWTMKIDGGTGSAAGGKTITDFMNKPISERIFHIVNGDNVRIDMIFDEDPPKDKPPRTDGLCNKILVQSYGDFFTRSTRVKVEAWNVSVDKTERWQGATRNVNNNAYNDINTFMPHDDGGGSTDSNHWARWDFDPNQPDIYIKVTYQWWDPDYNNGAGKPKGDWRTIPSTETTNAAGVKEPGAPNINGPVNCYTESLTCSITGIYGTGRAGEVLANEDVWVTATITNTGTREVNNPYLQGMGTYSSGAGPLDPGETSRTILAHLTAPGTVQNWNLHFDSVIPWVKVSGGCDKPTVVYKEYNTLAIATATLNKPGFGEEDEENPSRFNYTTSVNPSGMSGAALGAYIPYATCWYKTTGVPVRGCPPGHQDYRTQGSHPKAFVDGAASWPGAMNNYTLFDGENITPKVGDTYCSYISVLAGGYIAPGGGIVNPGGFVDDLKCATVHNKPYFKAYGKGVKSTGGFQYGPTDNCSTGGALASWNDNSVAGVDRGSGTELNALALVKIVGFASAQTAATRSPTDLTLANVAGGPSAPVSITNSSSSPDLGGSYGGNQCNTDVEPPDTATPASGDQVVGVGGAGNRGSKVIDGNAVINTSNLGLNDKQSVFVKGDVYIAGNIKYATTGWTGTGSASNIPSFVLHATGNIYISKDVTELDGLYIAKGSKSGGVVSGGRIYTCGERSGTSYTFTPMSSTDLFGSCKDQLKVRGAFVAYKVNLMRTHGSLRNAKGGESSRSGTSTDCSNGDNLQSCGAEIFDFSPEFYLSNPAIKNESAEMQQYDSITSLPPVL